MSFNRNDERTSMVECPCGATQPPSYRLSVCDHRGCETVGCHECLAECGVSMSCGRFCAEHLNEIEMAGLKKPLLACLRCESEDLDEAEERRAA